MNINCEKTLSLWNDTFQVPEFDSLKTKFEADVCIVGAGITGITTAYLLAREGKKVIVLDDGKIGGGETGSTTAHITSVIDDRFTEIEKLHGKENTKLAAQSQREAINTIEKIIKDENILCDFKRVNGYWFFKSDDKTFEEEYEAAIRAGMDVEIIDSPINAFKNWKCLKFSKQAQFHVLKYISALAEAIVRLKGKIFTGTFVIEIKDEESAVLIKTNSGFTVNAKDAVIATNSPISDYLSMHTKQVAYRTYVVAFEIEKNSIPTALYWDTEDPYHYIRIQPAGDKDEKDILIIGGEDHKTGQEKNPQQRFVNLEKWSHEHFENLGETKYKWSGQVLEPIDGLSFIGKDPENSNHVYIATGDSGMGMTHGTFSGLILCDLIMERENKWAELYDPKRINLKSAPEFIKEGATLVSQYIDLVTGGDVKDIGEIKKGEGAVMRDGLDKISIYKDESGNVFKFSALCTHLKCVLSWNEVEKSWDCPCHGSRFDCKGKVLNGPAISDMKEVKEN
ncbi:MAG: FAD-dependent oxidoreductase [Bacteroidota bacterium]|nr:FAD-dependent oxidoreductase [Bacteroidota bacterium]